MPQLDIIAYTSELFWFLTFFFGLYFYISIRFIYKLSAYQIFKSVFTKGFRNATSHNFVLFTNGFNSSVIELNRAIDVSEKSVENSLQTALVEVAQFDFAKQE